MDTKDIVFDHLEKSGVPLKGGEIAEKTGIEKKEVDKAIKKLKTEGKIISPKACYYSVNKED